MTIITHDYLPAVTCTSWCAMRDGHPHELFIADQRCLGDEARAITTHGDLSASLEQEVGGPVTVAVAIETDNPDRPVAEVRMSLHTFRAFVALAQSNVLDVDLDGGR